MSRSIAAALVVATITAEVTKLSTFDGAKGTTWSWRDTNDPVMGGASTSTFVIDKDQKIGIFNGTCAIVPSLNAPGFCKTTATGLTPFPDVAADIDGTMQLRVRSTTPNYKGYKIAFAAKDVPHTSIFGGGSFKAEFFLEDNEDWQIVKIPFNKFSYDWSGYTGRCDTKDPSGQQHECCDTNPKVCPTPKYLSTITSTEVWSEGVEGDFHIEIDWIGTEGASASAPVKDTVCTGGEYCCPDAKACLKPTLHSCKNNPTACPKETVCCPLTKQCVYPGKPCETPCDQGSYCCPDALHCLTPTNPGVICADDSSCMKGEVCCPLIKECVKVGDACTPP